MAVNFEKLRERLANVQGKKQNRDDIWWKPQLGDQTVRLLPTEDGDPLKDYWFHYNMGKHSGFLCPKRNFDDSCAVCDFASKLWHEGTDEDKELAKGLFARQRFFAAVVERDDAGGVKFETPKIWGFSKTVYLDLLGYFNDEDYKDISGVKDGNDIKVSYTKTKDAKFPKTDVKARPKKTPLCDGLTDETCKKILESVPNFLDQMAKKSSADVERILNEWSHESGEVDDTSTGVDPVAEAKEKTSSKKSEKKETKVKSDNQVDQSFEELLGQ